jgi:hypothetical protein
MGQPTNAPPPAEREPTEKEIAHAAHIKKLLEDPAFKLAEVSGKSYIIPGVKRPAPPK